MIKFASALLLTVVLFSCKNEGSSTSSPSSEVLNPDNTIRNNPADPNNTANIRLIPVESPAFPAAKLSLVQVGNGSDSILPGAVKLDFKVENYELGNQTEDADSKLCNNSGKGQHIHYISNGQPYQAFYTDDFEVQMDDGHYDVIAFLSRSYHESIKTSDAYVLTHFDVGSGSRCSFQSHKPHVFYSRPKGTYLGKDTKRVMLDFYLHRVELSEEGYKVRVWVGDEMFMITKWQPYFIEGLPMGNHSIVIELLDPEGNIVRSPFNPTKRIITLAEDEPLPSN